MVRYRRDPVTDEQGGTWMNAQGTRNGLIAVPTSGPLRADPARPRAPSHIDTLGIRRLRAFIDGRQLRPPVHAPEEPVHNAALLPGGPMTRDSFRRSVLVAVLVLLGTNPGLAQTRRTPSLPCHELPDADQGHVGKHPQPGARNRRGHARGQVRLQADSRRANVPGERHSPDRGELPVLRQGLRRHASRAMPASMRSRAATRS